MNLSQHPLSAAFPAMSAEDFQSLKDDIEVNGQREPVIVLDGMVLDGWHRYRACSDLGLKVTQFTFPEKDDPVAFVLSHNLHRRHLTASQRAAAVVACTAWAPKGRPGKAETISAFSRDKDMAKTAGTSDRTIRDAKVAHKAGLTDAVKQGALTAHEAAQVARGTPKPAPAKKLAPWDKPAPTPQPELDDAREAVSILSEENERLSDRLAVEAMNATEEEKTKAKETIESLRAQIKTLTAELNAVKSSRDAYMREVGELKKQCSAQRKQLDKLKVAA